MDTGWGIHIVELFVYFQKSAIEIDRDFGHCLLDQVGFELALPDRYHLPITGIIGIKGIIVSQFLLRI